MKTHRTQRVAHQVKRELADILRRHSSDFGGHFVTVTEVQVTRDLKNAKVWISILGESEYRQRAFERIQRVASQLRYLLGGRIRMRRIPELRFILDETLDAAQRIDNILTSSGIINKLENGDTETDE